MAEVAEVKLYNHDVDGLVRRINKFIVELAEGQSNKIDDVMAKDQERLTSYIGALRGYIDWVVKQPELDLSKTHPRELALPVNPEVGEIKNLQIRDVIRHLELARDELILGSDSSQRSSGFNKFDIQRVQLLLDKAEAFLTDYIKKFTPIDTPETSTIQ